MLCGCSAKCAAVSICRYYEVVQETGYLDQVLQEGAEAAEAAANRTLHNAFESMGFVPRPGLRR